jgi:histone H3/H4
MSWEGLAPMAKIAVTHQSRSTVQSSDLHLAR